MLIINTRPADRALGLTQALRQQGHQVFECPLLELKPIPQVSHQTVFKLQQIDLVIVVSPTAAQLGLKLLTEYGIDPCQLRCEWLAVGQATAAVLAQAGLACSVPIDERSEGMWDMPCIQILAAGSNCLIWCGEGGRQWMQQQLEAKGMQVDRWCLYQRVLPELAYERFAQLVFDHFKALVLITSAYSWHNWCALCRWRFGDDYQHALSLPTYYVLSERLAQMMCAQFPSLHLIVKPNLTVSNICSVLS